MIKQLLLGNPFSLKGYLVKYFLYRYFSHNIPAMNIELFSQGKNGFDINVWQKIILDGQCVQDSVNRVFEKFEGKYKKLFSPSLCQTKCFKLGFKYAGLQAGMECFCGNQFPSRSIFLPKSACSHPCSDPDHSDKMCGGGWKLNIYHAANVLE